MVTQRGLRGIQGKQGIQGVSGRSGHYINAKTFKEFCSNQHDLIDILNHRMTTIEESISVIKNDVSWTKRILWAILSVVVVCAGTILTKSVFGV